MTLSHVRRGSGEPLLLIHGIGSYHRVWDPLLDRLAAERQVVAIDLPGFGGSAPLPNGERPTPVALAGAVAGFMHELGWERAHLAGNSLGGWIALELAKRDRALSVSTTGAAGFSLPRERRFTVASLASLRRTSELMYDYAPRVLASPIARKLAFAQVFARGERMTVDEAVGSVRNLADSPGWHATLHELLAGEFSGGEQIDVPVTLMWGERERLIVPRDRHARRSLRKVPGARLLWLRGCGHTPTWDDPPQVAQAILDASRA